MNHSSRFITFAIVALMVCWSCSRPDPGRVATESFDSPEAAVTALIGALQDDDRHELRKLFGSSAEALLSSGDAVADQAARKAFLERYAEKHQLVAGSTDDLVLQVGVDDWPLPIPIVRRDGRWRFDGAAGIAEVVSRRIGANELRTIAVLRGYVEAQREYAAVGHDGSPPGLYAQRLRSDPGKQNGLYWEPAPGQPPSPIGPFIAAAAEEGYFTSGKSPMPYHGYHYRPLFAQGPAARGGELDYRVNGKLKRGYALLAYPSAYGVSGIMTFMVNHDGIIWQRDFGEQTEDLARITRKFNPDDHWTALAGEVNP